MFGMNGEINIQVYIWLFAVTSVVVGLFWLLTFKADKLVDLLKLGKGFSDDRIETGNIKSEDIIKIGTFIIGGLLIVENIPRLLSHIFWSFRVDIIGQQFTAREKLNLGVSALNILISILLFTNYDIVAKRISNKRNEN